MQGTAFTNRRTLAGAITLGIALGGAIAWYCLDLADDWGLSNPVFWLWAWFAWLGWLVVLGEVLHLPLAFGESWYRARPFERGGDLYAYLGVRFYKKLVPNGNYMNGVIRLFNPNRRIIKDAESMRRWIAVTRTKEASHAIHALMAVPAVLYVVLHGWLASVARLLALTLLLDLYLIMPQRYNRFRIERTLARDPSATRIMR